MGVTAAVWAQAAEVFEDFRVEDGGADFVDAGGPLAEIDFAAAVTAEGEVLVVEADQFAAGGAAEELGGFFLRSHGLVVIAKRSMAILRRGPLHWVVGDEDLRGWSSSSPGNAPGWKETRFWNKSIFPNLSMGR
jgi:hypothetical protein